MSKITDDDLTLLYYGEHDDPQMAAQVARSEELTRRLNALSAELELAEAWQPPERGEDYGAEVWQRISPHLEAHGAGSESRFKSWLTGFLQPRFSPAGVFALMLVAVLAFMLGRNGSQIDDAMTPQQAMDPATLMAGIDAEKLLASSVGQHLEQVDMVLTQFANSTESSATEAEWATDMLVANRLYRRAAANAGNQKLAAFLGVLEPMLIELAHEAHAASPLTRERMQAEVRDGLLFRVRVMNNQLTKPQVSL